MPNTRTSKLARWQIMLLTISGSLLWLSGAGWLLLHYYGQVPGEFGPQTNPVEPWFMRLHGLVLIPVLLGFGGLFVQHIPKGWKEQKQRIAGIALTAVLSALILSGYLLYYVGGDGLRAWTSLIHWAIGLASPAIFIWHYLGRTARKVAKKPAKRIT